mgnify:CR=1 FL=1
MFDKQKTLILLVLAGGFLLSLTNLSAVPAAAAPGEEESTPLCPPGVYQQEALQGDADCLSLGPSQYLSEMAEKGITFPQTPLPAVQPDPALSDIPYTYARVRNEKAPVYRTLQDAVKNRENKVVRRQPSGFTYVTFKDQVYQQGRNFYLTRSGWMSSRDLTVEDIPRFQGVEFTRTPERDFGWVLNYFTRDGRIETKRTPGYARDDYTGHFLDHLELVTIYDQKQVKDLTWYMVGPEEWIMQTSIAKITPRTKPPEGFNWKRWIEVNLYEQTVAIYDDSQLVFATLVASGDPPYWTYTGTFKIYKRYKVTGMRGRFPDNKNENYTLDKVPWTLYYDEARAFHGAYWRASLGFPQSHGCINMTLGDSHWLYDWAKIGDRVYVYDPSGRTPGK